MLLSMSTCLGLFYQSIKNPKSKKFQFSMNLCHLGFRTALIKGSKANKQTGNTVIEIVENIYTTLNNL